MRYTFRCKECGVEREIKTSVQAYDMMAWAILCVENPDHRSRKMERIYSSVQLRFNGEGFTGAGGVLPHMNKDKRKKDLESKTDVEGI